MSLKPESPKPNVVQPSDRVPPQSLRVLPRPQRVRQEQREYDWRGLRKPQGKVYTDAGPDDSYAGWELRYEKKESEAKDWRSYRKPSEQVFYSDTGHGYVKQYQKKPRGFMERRQPQGVFASDVGVYFGLSSYRPETTVAVLKSASELEWEQQQREFKLWRMISTSDLSDAEKEQLIIQVWPFTEQAFAEAHGVEASHKFYRDLGYSQFGGKYAPFTVPEGVKVKSITESGESLKIEFEQTGSVAVAPTSGFWDENRNVPMVKPTSGFMDQQIVPAIEKKIVKENWLSEQLYNVQMGSELVLTEKGLITQSMRPLAPLAFLIAPAEHFVYSLATMLRGPDFPSVSTPPATPTFFTNPSAVIHEGKTAMTASLLGEVLLSEMIGLFSTPVVEGVSGAAKTLGSGAKATGYLTKEYVTGTQAFKDWQLVSRGLAEGSIGEEPYMYLKNVFVPTMKGVYAPEVANTVRTQLSVLRGVPKQMFEGSDVEEIVLYRRGVLFNEPVTSIVGSAVVNEDLKLAARGLAEGFIGSERYSYLKSVAVPMAKEIYVPEVSQKVSTFFAVLHGVPAEAIKEIPNPVESWQMYHRGVLFNEPFVSIAFPHVAKPQDIMFLKSVFAPNIKQYYSMKLPSMTIDSEAWSFLTEPAKTVKAYGKVAAGKIRYDIGLHVSPSEFEHTPLVFDAPKETVKTITRLPEASQVAIQVKPEESLSVTGMPKPIYGYPFMSQSHRQREEETEYEVLSYPAASKSMMANMTGKPIVQADFLQPRSQSRALEGLSGFEVAPRLKPTAATFKIPKAETFSFSTFKPVSGLKFDQATKFKPVSGLRFDQAVKFNLQQFSGTQQSQKSTQAMQQSLKQLQKMVTPEKAVSKSKRKKKVAKRGSGWVTTKYPFPEPEDILRGFAMEVMM